MTRRHQRVLIERFVRRNRTAKIGISSVRTADLSAVYAVKPALSDRRITANRFGKRLPLHIGRKRYAEEFQKRCRQGDSAKVSGVPRDFD